MILFVTVAVSCGSVDGITVSDENDFKTVYVRGQELDLSGGVLVVQKGKKTTELPLDSEDISVSGYDKNSIGQQTVTVEYKDATTEFTVTVADRLTVNGAISDYLVGDTLNRSRGSVTVMFDDGTTKNVAFSGSEISVVGFDSATAGMNKSVKIVYNKDGNTYEGSYPVNIYAIEAVDLRRPNKISYGSHYDGEIDVTGGKLTMKGNGGKLKREVAITADMVSGFDVSVVTAENSPVTQVITVTYNGANYTYEINLTYTDVSMFNDNEALFADVDWNGAELPVIENELGELALSLMNSYMDMSELEKVYIDEDYLFDVARTAIVYGFNLWSKDVYEFRDSFTIEYGELVLNLKSYDAAKNALMLFDNPDSTIYTLAPLLIDIIDLFGDTIVYENETTRIYFSSYPVMDSEMLMYIEDMIDHAIYVYETIAAVPSGWSVSQLGEYADNIVTATAEIFDKTYVLQFPDFYYLVSEWRDDGDLLDILYAGLYKLGYESQVIYLSYYALPSDILVLYAYILDAVVAMDNIQNLVYTDTTKMIYNYYCALDCADKIKEMTGSVEKYLYDNLPLNSILGMTNSEMIDFEVMFEYLRTAPYGFNHLSAGLLDIDEYNSLMREYTSLVVNLLEKEGYESSEEYAAGIKSIFDKFIALSPTQQYNFIATLNSMYIYGLPELAFDTEGVYDGSSSLFSFMINEFMRSKFSDAYVDAYNNLILAIEVFANRVGYDEWKTDFSSRMDIVSKAYEKMEGEDKQNFDYYLSSAYEKYMQIFAKIDENIELGEWADDFAALDKALVDVLTAYYNLYSNSAGNYNYFLASFERAVDISENILKFAPGNVVYAYYYSPLFNLYSDSESSETEFSSYEYVISTYRNFYIEYLLFYGSEAVNIYDVYREKQLGEFLALYYDMISAYLNKTEGEGNVFDKEKTLLLLNAFKSLDSSTKSFFVTLEGNVPIYYSALDLFISEAFTENAAAVAKKLFSLETNYYSYEVSQSEVTLNSIREILSQIKELYEALEGEDETSFAQLEEIYLYYVEKCELLFA